MICAVFVWVCGRMTWMKKRDALCLVMSGYNAVMRSVVCECGVWSHVECLEEAAVGFSCSVCQNVFSNKKKFGTKILSQNSMLFIQFHVYTNFFFGKKKSFFITLKRSNEKMLSTKIVQNINKNKWYWST